MIFVLFEVKVKKEEADAYLALAAGLKDELERAEGFIRSERFQSLVDAGKILSLSVWENEGAVEKWRNTVKHRLSQRQGHDSLFESYTLTVASKVRSYTLEDRAETPEDSKVFFADFA
ncbi:antibiotic biosynthesis monooxygenase [Desulfovibrio sp. OttesenSCG-928-C06]|nr:antibiotic biosynthesis monooxygenase [Desulfovibrio sp. OttesenSCG-928-C06]